ncbi:MAG: protein kinase [Planctomycetia bacterium]|nr:protein kinase [Planctomycetia bacterium]
MANTTIGSLIDALRQLGLLDPAQQAELERNRQRFADAKVLLQTLVKQGWLTRWQAKQLINGRTADLVLGQYLVLEPLGEGGMGEVFKARQRNLNRLVAVKLIRQDRLGNADALKRFQREIRAVSQLAHPNVVRAYDADQIGDRHIFVMEFADGADLSHIVQQQGALPIPLACEYIRQAALGLQHAHERGLVHRDIKPSNLLLTKSTEKGKPGLVKVLDLGLSRLRESQNNETTIDATMTRDGSVVGTPDYMSPEQARDSHTVDIRADIYSLGCTLYYLLAGAVPYPGGTGMEKVFKHQLEEPEPIERLRKDIPRALAAIVRKMMAKAADDRYQTPAEVARVLEPFAPTSAAAFQESLKPAPASGRQLDAARAASETPAQGVATRKDLAAEQRRGRGGRRFAVFLTVGLLLAGAAGLAFWLRPAQSSAGATTPSDRDPVATGTLVQGTTPVGSLKHEATLGDPRLRHWGAAVCTAVSADGKLASGAMDHVVRLWDARTGQETAALRGHASLILCLAFSPDGRLLASGGMDNTVRLWDTTSGQELHCFKDHTKEVAAVAFSPDGTTLASGGADRVVKLWDMKTRQSRAALPYGGPVRQLSFSPDGKWLAGGAFLGVGPPTWECKVWDWRAANATATYRFPNCPQLVLAFSPTQPLLALGSSSSPTTGVRGTVHLEHLGNRKESQMFNEAAAIQALAFLPDGESLVVAQAQALKIYAVGGKAELRWWHVLEAFPTVRGVAAFADGKTLVTAHTDCALRLWNVDKSLRPQAPPTQASPWRSLVVSADGQTLVGASEIDSFIRAWDLKTLKERWTVRGLDGGIQTLSIAANGQHVLAGGVTGLAALQGSTGQRLGDINDDTWGSWVALSPDGNHAALFNQPQGITLHEAPSCKLLHTLTGHTRPATQGAFSPDGRTLASVSGDGTLRLWDVAGRNARATLNGVPLYANAMRFAPDGSLVAGAFSPNGPNSPGEIRLWNAGTGKEAGRTTDASGIIFELLVGAQGKSIIYTTKDGLKVWDSASGQKWSPPQTAGTRPGALALSPDGQTLAATFGNRLLLGNLPARSVVAELSLPGPLHGLAFTPSGDRLLTANGNGTVFVYRLERP